jgi:hypothetical protein
MRRSAPEKDYVPTDLTLVVCFHGIRHCGSIAKWSGEEALPMKFGGGRNKGENEQYGAGQGERKRHEK